MMLLSVRRSAAATTRAALVAIWLALVLILAATAAAEKDAAAAAAASKNKTNPVKTKAPVVSSPGEAEARYSGAVRGDDVWTPPPTATVADTADGGGSGGEGPCKTAVERMLSPVSRRRRKR